MRKERAVEEKLDAAMDDLMKKGRALTRRAPAAAERIASAVEDEIRDLRMAGARFEVFFREQPGGEDFRHFGPHGQDDVAFYLSTNPGEDPKPLSRVASGGELSRIVLAMKKVLAGQGGGTIIFDEVDSGIGGATASVVGEKIHEVARHHQVLCITHLPQIACFADRHYRVMKRVIGEKTVTSVEILSHEERLDELTRMLGGMDVTEAARIHAREMLRNAGTDQRFRIREEKETPC
jgi:DNA repair protein RecN (Recombination protein N)